MREETGRHLTHLDGWRGLAVALVVIGHFGADSLWYRTSTFGVELFFVLSGRLMAEILFVRRTDLPSFFIRRFSRVFPALLAFVVVTAIALDGTPYGYGIMAAMTALTFTLNYAMLYVHRIPVLDHLWSLCVEEHAYLILAAFAYLARRWGMPLKPVIATVTIAAVINGVVRADLLGQDFFHVHWRSDVAIAGIFASAIFWIVLHDRKVSAWVAPTALIAAVVCRIQSPEVVSFGLATTFLALAITTLDHAAGALRSALSQPILRQFGLWSFSIYLWQPPFYKLNHDGVASTWVLVAGLFACALASFYLIERPARRFINSRSWARPPDASSEVGGSATELR